MVGARPNFMKMAPLYSELKKRKLPVILLHTGQHYDENMSRVFFEDLGMPKPDIYLGVGSESHAKQTAKIMIDFEQICYEKKPQRIIVAGDVNSTLACALVAVKLNIAVDHVEAGLRSFDNRMPEEINRIITDQISTLLYTPSEDANLNLKNEAFNFQQSSPFFASQTRQIINKIKLLNFKEIKSLIYDYRDKKEQEIKKLNENHQNLRIEIETNQKNYEKLIDEAAEEISNFVEKVNLENLPK